LRAIPSGSTKKVSETDRTDENGSKSALFLSRNVVRLDPPTRLGEKQAGIRHCCRSLYLGDFAMSSADRASNQPTDTGERKVWETPVVIVGSTQRETLSSINTGGVDGTSTGSPFGS
jgi:hypothetical protein